MCVPYNVHIDSYHIRCEGALSVSQANRRRLIAQEGHRLLLREGEHSLPDQAGDQRRLVVCHSRGGADRGRSTLDSATCSTVSARYVNKPRGHDVFDVCVGVAVEGPSNPL